MPDVPSASSELMPEPDRVQLSPAEPLVRLIRCIRAQRVILDADLARIYGVETRARNQALKRNRERFPDDFAFDLTRDEILRISHTVISLRRLRFSNTNNDANS